MTAKLRTRLATFSASPKNPFIKEFKEHGIGNTILKRSKSLSPFVGCSELYLKYEGGNPTGTMKDRASYATIKLAKSKGFKTIAVASCGNFGASIVFWSKIFGIIPHVYIPESYHSPRIREMESQQGIIHREPGTYEDLVDLSRRESEEQGWYDGNPGSLENAKISLRAYETIAYEIVDELRCGPDVVSVPVSNGTCFAGIYQGFNTLARLGIINRVPIMVAGGTEGGNPIITSFQDSRRKIKDLDPTRIIETEDNEPIVNWRSLDGQRALDALWESSGYAELIGDETMITFSQLIEKEAGLSVLPASSTSLAALFRFAKTRYAPEINCAVAVLTGRNYLDENRPPQSLPHA